MSAKIEKVVGIVSYDVRVQCPVCKNYQYLNQVPHNEQFAEDELGNAVFGSVDIPAKWKGLSLEYKCALCKTPFVLERLEY